MSDADAAPTAATGESVDAPPPASDVADGSDAAPAPASGGGEGGSSEGASGDAAVALDHGDGGGEGGDDGAGGDSGAAADGEAAGEPGAVVHQDLPFNYTRVQLLGVINNDRAEAGLPPVEMDDDLCKAADAHCKQMGTAGYLGHVSLEGLAPFHRYFFAGCRDHVVENVHGLNAGEGEVFDTTEGSMQTFALDAHATLMTAEPPHDQGRRHTLGAGHTHVGIGLYLDDKRFRLVEVFADRYVEVLEQAPDGEESPGFTLTTDETSLYAKCTRPGYGILACVVFYEPPPQSLSRVDVDGVTAYDDFTPERVSVVWPWEMERRSDGVVHIPVFFNAVQPGLYYTQILVRGDVDTIPYTGPSEDLDITSPDAVPATGIVLRCDQGGDTSWTAAQALTKEADVDGDELDMIVAGIEPFSEVVLCKGSEPTLLGFKRQAVLTTGSATDPVVVCVANAPGLPPVCGVTLVAGDGPEDSVRAPDGYDLISPNIATILRESEAVKAALKPPAATTGDGAEDGEDSKEQAGGDDGDDDELVLSPVNLFLAVKRQLDDVDDSDMVPSSPSKRSISGDEPLLLDIAVSVQLPTLQAQALPSGYDTDAVDVRCSQGSNSATARLVVAWSTSPDAVADVLAAQEADRAAGVDAGADGAGAGAGAGAGVGAGADAGGDAVDVDDEEALKAALEFEEDKEEELQAAVEDVEAIAKRKLAERQRVTMLLADAKEEREELFTKNRELQRMLAAYFLMRQMEEEKTVERVGGSAAGAGAGAGGPMRPSVDAEPKYFEVLQEVVGEKQRLGETLKRCDAQAMELQVRLDDKEARAKDIHQSFVEFKREIAQAAENSRTGKPIPRRIITQFEATELAKDREVEKVRLKNIHLRAQLRKLEAQIKEKEQLADGLHLIDFEQLKIENQTLNEKIEDNNEELHKLRKKTTQTVQVLTHVKEKLQFVQAEAAVLKEQLATVEAAVSQQRDTLSRAKQDREKARAENERLKQSQGFVTNDKLVLDFEKRKKNIKALTEQLAELKDRYLFLTAQTQTRRRGTRGTRAGAGAPAGAV